MLSILIGSPEKTAEEIAKEVGVTKRTIERTFVSLKKKGLIERIGSNKNGSWAVVQ
ncbi:MAG: HTH domain-containing protein [Lachnospiraceae bacterium]|nr:HTH domain-containing protein [Lachnospiraceae bacterium]